MTDESGHIKDLAIDTIIGVPLLPIEFQMLAAMALIAGGLLIWIGSRIDSSG